MSDFLEKNYQINVKHILLFTVVIVVIAIIYHSYNSENFKSRNYNCGYDCDCGCNEYNCNDYDDYGCYDYNCNNYGCEEYFGDAAVSSLGAEYFGGVGLGQELSAEYFGDAAVSSLGAEHFGKRGRGRGRLSQTGIDTKGIGRHIRRDNKNKVIEGFLIS